MPRFAITGDSLFRRLPFSDTARVRLRAFATAIQRELVGPTASGKNLQDALNEVYDGTFITYATSTDLDAHGVDLDTPRLPAEADAAYRARLLIALRDVGAYLSHDAIEDAINTKGATYAPAITVVRIDEHDGDWVADSTNPADTWSAGDVIGLSDLDLLTFSVILSRIPTHTEAKELIEELDAVKLAQARGCIAREVLGVGGPDILYRYGTAYSLNIPQYYWEDSFERDDPWFAPIDLGLGTDLYQVINAAGALSFSLVSVGPGDRYLFGDASQAGAGPTLCLPRQDLDEPIIVDRKNMYVEASMKFGIAPANNAGLCMRYDDGSGELYYVAFRFSGGLWDYAFFYWDGALMNTIINWTNTGKNLANYNTVQAWLEDNLFTLIVGGTLLEDATDIGTAITVPGEFGFCLYGGNRDLYANYLRMW